MNPPIPTHAANPRAVIVIGAGIAGLSAALSLAERGVSPLVLEADPHFAGGRVAGGPVAEFEHQGEMWQFRGEHGIHGFWSQYHNLRAVLKRNTILPHFNSAIEEEWILARHGHITRAAAGSAIRDSFFPAPFHYAMMFLRPRFWTMLGLRDWLSIPLVLGRLLGALSIDPLREGKSLRGLTLEDFCRGWSPSLRAFFAGLARSGLSAHPEEVPLDGFIAFLRFYTLLRRDSWRFDYLTADSGIALIEPMLTRLQALGGEVILGAQVTQIQREDEPAGWRVRFDFDGNPIYTRARRLILATDAPAAQRILRHSPDTAPQAEPLIFPTGLSTAVVRLWFNTAPRFGPEAGIFTGDFILDNFFWLHRFQTDFALWHAATGGSALEAHVYGPPAVIDQLDAVLLAQMITDVYRAWPELRGQLAHQVLRRNPAAHTLFKIGASEDRLATHTPWPGITACGDWVRHPTPALFLERACVTGIDAANAVLEALGKSAWPLVPHTKPELLAGLMEKALRGSRHLLRALAKRKSVDTGKRGLH
ncbi:MAG TPA: FAD-dependent oxidoreductase [Anaerolineae bacterium]|nr:FAD-dependent oxidoreductase [Anaerolineae bacterium]